MLHYFICIFLTFTFSENTIFAADSDYIKCPLIWASKAKGEGISASMVSSTLFGQEHFIARVLINGVYYAGRFEKSLSLAYFPDSGNITEPTHFEVLTNPHKCIINWYTGKNTGEHAVGTGKLDNYIGRTIFNDVVLAGNIEFDTITFAYDDVKTSSKYDTLQSYSKGLNMAVSDFTFPNGDPSSGGKDILGTDEIHNRGPTFVKQIVTHTKRVKESTTTSTSKTWSHTFKADFSITPEFELPGDISAKFFTVKFGYQFQNKNEQNKSVSYSQEVEVSVTREVTVPPYTSVQICSSIDTKENFVLDYNAKARYTAPGLNGDEVAQILIKDGLSGAVDFEGVTVTQSGTFRGSIAMATKLIIIPFDVFENCSNLQSKILKLKREKALKMLTSAQINQRNIEIDNMMNRMLKMSIH